MLQAASELKGKENMNRDTSYAKPLAITVHLSRRNVLSQNDLLPKQEFSKESYDIDGKINGWFSLSRHSQ